MSKTRNLRKNDKVNTYDLNHMLQLVKDAKARAPKSPKAPKINNTKNKKIKLVFEMLQGVNEKSIQIIIY